MNCYCCSGKKFDVCCEPILINKNALTAEQLMRSRYTAYVLHKADYILNTTYAKTRSSTDYASIKQWAEENTWQKLEILYTTKGLEHDTTGIVAFKAYYKDKRGNSRVHHEISEFIRDEDKWYYVDGQIGNSQTIQSQKINRNSPCSCGSGKKYKKCCGK